MGIISIDGFEFYDDIKGNPEAFILKGVDLDEEINYIINKEIKSIALSCFDSNTINDLSFLTKIPFLKKISLDGLDFSYQELYILKELKELVINVKNKNQHLDYSKFEQLEVLSIDWYSGFPNLSKNINLKELSIWKFKPKSKSLAELSLPNSLEKVHISESNIISLEGLELNDLKEFEGHYCNGLETVKGIDKFSNNLKVLILDYCRKLSSYEDLKYTEKLNKLILGNCGDILNIKWLKGLKNIKHFSFWNTKLIDGDTSPCLGIEYVSFKNQKHYNYREEDIKMTIPKKV